MKLQLAALAAAMIFGPMASMAEPPEWKKIPEIMRRGGTEVEISKKCTRSKVAVSQISLGQQSDKHIEISARRSAGRNIPKGRELTFEGNVRVSQGDFTLTCDKLIIVYDKRKGNKFGIGEIRSIECLCDR